MAKIVRLANGNTYVEREKGEEGKSLDQLRPKLELVSGVRLNNGNVWIPPKKSATPDEDTQILDEEKGAPVLVATRGPRPAWELKMSPGSYLRRFGVGAEHSARALGRLGLTAEEWADTTGIKLQEPPPPDGGGTPPAPDSEMPKTDSSESTEQTPSEGAGEGGETPPA